MRNQFIQLGKTVLYGVNSSPIKELFLAGFMVPITVVFSLWFVQWISPLFIGFSLVAGAYFLCVAIVKSIYFAYLDYRYRKTLSRNLKR